MFGMGANSGQFHYYVCATGYRQGKEVCPTRAVPQHTMEQLILDKVTGLILQREHLKELVRLTNLELEGSLDELGKGSASLDSQLQDVDRRLERLYEALETKKVDLDDLAPRIHELRQRRDLLERARQETR